jgi:hypothetical protein
LPAWPVGTELLPNERAQQTRLRNRRARAF